MQISILMNRMLQTVMSTTEESCFGGCGNTDCNMRKNEYEKVKTYQELKEVLETTLVIGGATSKMKSGCSRSLKKSFKNRKV